LLKFHGNNSYAKAPHYFLYVYCRHNFIQALEAIIIVCFTEMSTRCISWE